MKFFKSFLLVAAVAGLFASCSDEGYWDAYNFKNDTYSFEQGSHSYSLKGTEKLDSVVVTVYRSTTKGNVDVPTILTANSNIISADTAVHFVDGSSIAEIVVKIDNSNIEIGKNYKAEITFDVPAEQLSISGANTYTLTFVKEYNWVVAGSGIWASSFSGEQFAVEFEMAEGYENGYYCRVAPYKKGSYIPFFLDENADAVECPANNYNTGVTYAGAALVFHHDPAGNYAKYCSFTNEGNHYMLNGIWNTAEGLYVANEQFLWTEGWPGE